MRAGETFWSCLKFIKTRDEQALIIPGQISKTAMNMPTNSGDWMWKQDFLLVVFGLSFSTASRTYELSEETHVTPFHTYRFHSTGLCNYKPQERTYRRTTCCRYRLTVRKYWVQSNVFHIYGRVSRGLFPRVRRYGLLYLRTVEYDQCFCKRPTERNCNTRVHYWFDFCKRHMTITL